MAEIGVHHGKFLLLLMMLAPNDHAFAVDIFDRQDLNLDHSGKGNKAAFLSNVARLCGNPKLSLIEDSSLNVRKDQFTQPIRLFSVDGGHSVECTINDLQLASETLSDGGVVILDDVFNEAWPEVADGLSRFLANSPTIVPFAISPNKVYLCAPEWRERYRPELRHRLSGILDRSLRLFGTEVDIFGVKVVQRDYIRYGFYRIRAIASRFGI